MPSYKKTTVKSAYGSKGAGKKKNKSSTRRGSRPAASKKRTRSR